VTLHSGQTLDQVLESAIIVSWEDLAKASQSALLHLEYASGPDGSLEYLKVWSSATRGQWQLACEYWMSVSAFHDKGVRFENGFRSEALRENLELIMQHQLAFSPSLNSGRTGLLQIQAPTDSDKTAAVSAVRDAYLGVNVFLAGPHPA
jgi:hypothetical protein